jgi:hypothetical protein
MMESQIPHPVAKSATRVGQPLRFVSAERLGQPPWGEPLLKAKTAPQASVESHPCRFRACWVQAVCWRQGWGTRQLNYSGALESHPYHCKSVLVTGSLSAAWMGTRPCGRWCDWYHICASPNCVTLLTIVIPSEVEGPFVSPGSVCATSTSITST